MKIGSNADLPSYDEALADPAKARVLFDASKGGNVRGITEDHRFELAIVFQGAAEPIATVSQAKLNIGGDYGSETYIRTIHSDSFLAFRRALRDLNPGTIPIYSPYDCTGLVCSQSCKLLSVYRMDGYVVGVVELNVQRDV